MIEPLTPPDCDLRDFAFMPLDGARLFGSEFHALASDAAWRAGVTLWLKAWHQVPAASLPDDDIQLARLAELGRDVRAWRKAREQALRGWIKCSDGRLYHPVVAEKANEAWSKKQSYRDRSKKGNEKRWASQKDKQQQSNSDPLGKALVFLEPPKGQGEGQGDTSVSNETAPVEDFDKQLWDTARSYLGPSKASLIGKWCKVHGKPAVAAAITQAQVERPADRIEFISGILRKRAKAMEWASPC